MNSLLIGSKITIVSLVIYRQWHKWGDRKKKKYLIKSKVAILVNFEILLQNNRKSHLIKIWLLSKKLGVKTFHCQAPWLYSLLYSRTIIILHVLYLLTCYLQLMLNQELLGQSFLVSCNANLRPTKTLKY